MICKECNTHIDDSSAVCPVCGAYGGNSQSIAHSDMQAATAECAYRVPADYSGQQNTSAQPSSENSVPEWAPSPTRILVYGILSLAISGIPGIILGALAQKNASLYAALCRGNVPSMVNTGRILGKVGFIVSIVGCVLGAIYIFFYIMFFLSIYNWR